MTHKFKVGQNLIDKYSFAKARITSCAVNFSITNNLYIRYGVQYEDGYRCNLIEGDIEKYYRLIDKKEKSAQNHPLTTIFK